MKKEKATEDQARSEFNQLLYDDSDFQAQWGYCEGSQTKINEDDTRILTHEQALEEQENAFYEWCSLFDDYKHIERKDKNEG
jgi:hypothetical protein